MLAYLVSDGEFDTPLYRSLCDVLKQYLVNRVGAAGVYSSVAQSAEWVTVNH